MACSTRAASIVNRDPRLWTTRDLNIDTIETCQTGTYHRSGAGTDGEMQTSDAAVSRFQSPTSELLTFINCNEPFFFDLSAEDLAQAAGASQVFRQSSTSSRGGDNRSCSTNEPHRGSHRGTSEVRQHFFRLSGDKDICFLYWGVVELERGCFVSGVCKEVGCVLLWRFCAK